MRSKSSSLDTAPCAHDVPPVTQIPAMKRHNSRPTRPTRKFISPPYLNHAKSSLFLKEEQDKRPGLGDKLWLIAPATSSNALPCCPGAGAAHETTLRTRAA